ncbi:MAG: hypothetical protein WC551_08960 [Patescibacteria group bacterium]
MPCDTLYRRLEVMERVKIDTAIEALVKALAQGTATVKTDALGRTLIQGWKVPAGFSDLCCLGMVQVKAQAMQQTWQAALRLNPALKQDFVKLHDAAHAAGKGH